MSKDKEINISEYSQFTEYGYQPQSDEISINEGYQPTQQQSNQPVSQMKPPSTGSGIK